MTRLPGALFAFAACAAAGMACAAKYREKEKRLSLWEHSLYRLKSAAETGGMSLPMILKYAGDNPVLAFGAELLEKEPGMTAERWLAELPPQDRLPPDLRALLRELLLSLFDYPSQRQVQGLNRQITEFQPLRKREKEKNERNAALALRLGLLAGAAVFILLC